MKTFLKGVVYSVKFFFFILSFLHRSMKMTIVSVKNFKTIYESFHSTATFVLLRTIVFYPALATLER